MNNIYEIFRKAQLEANKQKIHANAIVISPGLAYYAFDGELPSMILGMRCLIDSGGELPDDCLFSIVDSEPVPTDKEKIRAEYLSELKRLSLDDLIKEVYGVDLKGEQNDS